jgi:hypothetical protein
MTYNFDPERWYDNEYEVLQSLRKAGKLNTGEFQDACEDLLKRYERMLERLDGTYRIPPAS